MEIVYEIPVEACKSKIVFLEGILFFLLHVRVNEKIGSSQDCQMVYFQTKNPNLGKFWSVLQRKMMVNFMSIWSILLPFRIFYIHTAIWYVLWSFLYIFPVLVGCIKKIWQPWILGGIRLFDNRRLATAGQSPFRPKTFRTIFNPQNLVEVAPKNNRHKFICSNKNKHFKVTLGLNYKLKYKVLHIN
jgi:hypothetical protein